MPRRERRSFTPEFKARTVELIESSGKSMAEVCRELDLTQSAVAHVGADGPRGRPPGPLSAFLDGGRVLGGHCVPVHNAPPGIQIRRTLVLVVQVVGVLPHVHTQNRGLAL